MSDPQRELGPVRATVDVSVANLRVHISILIGQFALMAAIVVSLLEQQWAAAAVAAALFVASTFARWAWVKRNFAQLHVHEGGVVLEGGSGDGLWRSFAWHHLRHHDALTLVTADGERIPLVARANGNLDVLDATWTPIAIAEARSRLELGKVVPLFDGQLGVFAQGLERSGVLTTWPHLDVSGGDGFLVLLTRSIPPSNAPLRTLALTMLDSTVPDTAIVRAVLADHNVVVKTTLTRR